MRWEEKTAGVQALRYRIVDVRDAFITLAEGKERHDPVLLTTPLLYLNI
jgi:hypothetical protein